MDGAWEGPAAPPVVVGPRRAAPGRGPRTCAGVAVVLTVIVLGWVGVSARGLWVYANHDRIELIDDPTVVRVVNAACVRMNEQVAASAVPAGAPVDRAAAAIRAQDAAVEEMVASVRTLGTERLANDRPTQAWLADWSTLVAAREQYAAALASGGTPTWAVPVADGKPITRRMATVDAPCDAAALADLP